MEGVQQRMQDLLQVIPDLGEATLQEPMNVLVQVLLCCLVICCNSASSHVIFQNPHECKT